MNPLSHVLEKCTHTEPHLGRKWHNQLHGYFAGALSSSTCTDDGEKRIKVIDWSGIGNVLPILLKLECGKSGAPSAGIPNHSLQRSFCVVDSVIRIALQSKSHLLSPMVLRHCDVKKKAARCFR